MSTDPTASAKAPELTCAVCGADDLGPPASPACRNCGALTDRSRDDLERAQRKHDLRALARIHQWVNDRGLERIARRISTLQSLRPDELRAAVDRYHRNGQIHPPDGGAAHPRPCGPGAAAVALTALVRHLVRGEFASLGLVEVSPFGLATVVIRLDSLGVPRLDHPEPPIDLFDQRPPPDTETRLYWLAGGMPRDGGDTPLSSLRRHELVRSFLDSGSYTADETLLLVREPEWPGMASLATDLSRLLRPGASVASAGTGRFVGETLARQAISRAPLRHGVHLVVAKLGPKHRARPHLIELFPAGSVPLRTADRHVVVQLPDDAPSEIYLPVLQARAGDPPHSWRTANLFRVATNLTYPASTGGFQAKGTLRVEASLGPSGDVELSVKLLTSADDGLVSEGASAPSSVSPPLGVEPVTEPAWTDVLNRVPSQYSPAQPLDLLIAVELDGRSAPTNHQVVADLLERLAPTSDRSPGKLLVAVVGYRNHPTWGHRRAGVLEVRDFETPRPGPRSTPECAIGAPSGSGHSTAMEDALALGAAINDRQAQLVGAERPLSWRPGADRALIVVGSRPPCPPRDGHGGFGAGRPCPHRIDATQQLAALRIPRQRRAAAVTPGVFWSSDATDGSGPRERRLWEEIGGDHLVLLSAPGTSTRSASRTDPTALEELLRAVERPPASTTMPLCVLSEHHEIAEDGDAPGDDNEGIR